MDWDVAVPVSYASLLARSGSLRGERFEVRAVSVRIGRAFGNEVVIADPSVSATHATLRWREGLWILGDAGSTGGTYVDGEAVTEEMPLVPGASVRLGDVTLLFEPREEPAASPPPETSAGVVPEAAPTLVAPDRTTGPSSGQPHGTPGWLVVAVVAAALAGAAVGFVLLR